MTNMSIQSVTMRQPGVLPVVRRLIGGFDNHLSAKQGVRPFSDDAACLLRYAPVRSRHDLRLADGTKVNKGDLVVDLHCWNDRVPTMVHTGPDLAWAQTTAKRFRHSLRLLARAMATEPELAAATACRAQVNFVGQGGSNASVSRIILRMGFEDADEGPNTLTARAHRGLENVLIAALVWTHNPEALRRDKLLRERRPVWASRAQLLRVHGPAGATAESPSQAA